MLDLISDELLIKKFITFPLYIVTQKTVGRELRVEILLILLHVQRSMVVEMVIHSIIVVDEIAVYFFILCVRMRLRSCPCFGKSLWSLFYWTTLTSTIYCYRIRWYRKPKYLYCNWIDEWIIIGMNKEQQQKYTEFENEL